MKSKLLTLSIAEPVKAEQALVLPGKLFFVETIDIPEELEVLEIPDFAELSLESSSPFPLDQLYWGYLYHKDAATLLLYAAHGGRIKNEGFSDLDDYMWVVPDFATLAGARFHEDTLVLLEGENSVSLAYFESDVEIPKSVSVDAATETVADATLQLLKADIPGLPKTIPTLHLRPTVATLTEKGLPTFSHATSDQADGQGYDGNWQTLSPSESQLWQMDVRSVDFKAAEKNKRRMRSLISRIAGWAAIFALALVGIEGMLFASQAWLQTQFNQIASQQDAVSKVEEKQILVNKLEQVAQNELRPIEMLEAANNIRLKLNLGIEYDRVVIEGDNHITIEGKANSVGALNRYAAGLKDSGLFEILVKPDPSTDKGKTTFRVSLAYQPKRMPSKEIPSPVKDTTTGISLFKKEVRSG